MCWQPQSEDELQKSKLKFQQSLISRYIDYVERSMLLKTKSEEMITFYKRATICSVASNWIEK